MFRNRNIRRSQCISPFGVGAVFDIGDESLVACDITQWVPPSSLQTIRLKRLEKRLHVKGFKLPPVPKGIYDNNPTRLPFFRFPRWLFCPKCRSMTFWNNYEMEKKNEVPRCDNSKCSKKNTLVPMRFVMVCENGHLSDVPWDYWVHAKSKISKTGRCGKRSLKFRTKRGRGSGLESLEIYCTSCKQFRSLKGIVGKESMKAIGVKCSGAQPWQRRDSAVVCEATPRVLQRGATNVYYPTVISALDIPCGSGSPESQHLNDDIKSHGYFKMLIKKMSSSSGDFTGPVVEALAEEIAASLGCDKDEVLKVAKGEDADEPDIAQEDRVLTDEELLIEEWPSLVNPPNKYESIDRYIARSVDISLESLKSKWPINEYIEKLVLVERLREVRTLRGFHRVTPGDLSTLIPVDLGRSLDWLPAIEVFGEGIFIQFSEESIIEWQTRCHEVHKGRMYPLMERIDESGLRFLPEANTRFIMLHTFAHLLMRQLSFECGYSASSLRERIYSLEPNSDGGPMAGVLIYTADSDSEGALGGLVRQGNPERLIPTIMMALERSSWCSADPICRELPGQGLGGLNRAACHACCLVSETSCVYSNTLLDRLLVIGKDDENGELGYFSKIITS